MRLVLLVSVCVSAAFLGADRCEAQQTRFTPLGDLPGGTTTSNAKAIGASGFVVACNSKEVSPSPKGFLWTEAGGPVPLQGATTFARTFVEGVTPDGSLAVGRTTDGSGFFEPALWDSVGALDILAMPPTSPGAVASGISRDGRVICGYARGPIGTYSTQAVRWRDKNLELLGHLPGYPASFANGTDADGDVVVGCANFSSMSGQAMRWTEFGGMQPLPFLPGGKHRSVASACSSDGSMVVGSSDMGSPASRYATRWDAAGNPQLLTPTSVWSWSEAFDVSADGSTVVGRGVRVGVPQITAFVWTPTLGATVLRDLLLGLGETGVLNWELYEAVAVTADGRGIAGTGFNAAFETEAFLVWLDAPAKTYCSAKANSLGCVPSIEAVGAPSASGVGSFDVAVSQVRNDKPGLFLHVVNGGRVALPFQGGLLCVGPVAIRRTVLISSGGTPAPASDCSGVFVLDFNAFATGALGGNPSPALLVAGNTYVCQAWGRDQGFAAPNNTTLSDALDVTIGM